MNAHDSILSGDSLAGHGIGVSSGGGHTSVARPRSASPPPARRS